ncbi:MAG TPA: cytochrome P450 [Acidimicrobiia bacterium]|nr:cytochrome P450 [Acidimicrobiia bacterium]
MVAALDALADPDRVLEALLATPEGQADPYALYHRLRESSPLHRSGLDGLWYASRYHDCRQILLDPRCGRRPGEVVRRHGMTQAQARRFARRRSRPNMLSVNPPDHTRLRGATRGWFTPAPLERLAPRIGEIVDDCLDVLAAHGDADVMADLAFPLPVTVIGEVVGVPAGDRDALRPLVWAIIAADQPGAPDALVEDAEDASDRLDDFFVDLIAERRARPADDLLSELVAAADQGILSGEELLATVTLLFVAGFVTTTNLIGNGLLALLRHPDQLARLAGDPGLLPLTVDEILRYDGPVQMTQRAVLADIDLGGRTLRAGDTVMTILGAANRDPHAFADPDRFDVTRADNPPLAFGYGIHHCLGAGLARLEGRIVFRRLLERFSDLELLDPDPPRHPGFFGRRLARLPVRLTPR